MCSGSTPAFAPQWYETGSACSRIWNPSGAAAHRSDRVRLERTRHGFPPGTRGPGELTPEQLLHGLPAPGRSVTPPHGLQSTPDGDRQLIGIQPLLCVALAARGAEAQRHQVLPGVPEAHPRRLVVGVEMREPVPPEGLQLRTPGPGPHRRLDGQLDQVGARVGLGDAGCPRVAVPVGVDHGGVRKLLPHTGVVREHHPGVHVETGPGERVGGLPVRVARRPVPGGVRPEPSPLPPLVRGVEHGGVRGGDDPVPGMPWRQGARGVVRGGERRLPDAEPGDPPGGLRVSVDVPGVDERRRLHTPSSISPYPRSISCASCFTWSSVGSCNGGRTSPTSSPRSRTPALTSETAYPRPWARRSTNGR